MMSNGKNIKAQKKNWGLVAGALGVFIVCSAIGFRISAHKALWSDEIKSQVTLTRNSYADILLGRMNEGNNSPLFYMIQKVLCDLAGYVVPGPWARGEYRYEDFYSQIFLRIQPVVSISLAIALIFFYFTLRYSLWAGFYSFLTSISTFMVLTFIAESRPYALLFLLTTLQLCLALELLRTKEPDPRLWRRLTVVHVLLCLTAVFSIVQVAAVCVVLWFFVERRWQKYIGMAAVPFTLSMCYWYYAIKNLFWFKDTPAQLIFASFPTDRLAVVFIFGLYALACRSRLTHRTIPREVNGFFFATISMIIGSCLVLTMLKIQAAVNLDNVGCQVPNRYFICLASLGIMATTLFAFHLVKACRHKPVKAAVVLGLILLLGFRFWRTHQLTQHFFR